MILIPLKERYKLRNDGFQSSVLKSNYILTKHGKNYVGDQRRAQKNGILCIGDWYIAATRIYYRYNEFSASGYLK